MDVLYPLYNTAVFLLTTALERLDIFTSFMNNQDDDSYKDRQGAFVSIRHKGTGNLLAAGVVGEPPPEKMEKYLQFSLEKGERLFRHPGHITSHQSRDVSNEQYGGAIVCDELIISCSGFPEKADSLFCLDIALAGGYVKRDGELIHKIIDAAKIADLWKKFVWK